MELPGSDAGPESARPISGPTAANWLHYAVAAAGRRRLLFAVVFVAGVLAALAYYRLSTPMYRVETRIMVQNQGFVALGRGVTPDDAPTRSVFDLVHRRENLLALLEHAGVTADAPPAADDGGLASFLSEALASVTGGAKTAEPPLDALVRRLDKALIVTAVDGTITIAVDWPEAGQALKLVDGALQNFLEDRHVQEITMADEAVALLQPRVTALREQAELISDEVRQSDQDASRRSDRPVVISSPGEPTEDLIQIKGALDTKLRAIADVEEIRRRRQTDLQTQLDAQRAVLSDVHPTIISLRQDIAAMSRDSPQVVVLKEEARKLRQEYNARLARNPGRRTIRTLTGGTREVTPVDENERVRRARFEYQQMTDRLNVAMLERDAAGAAFKYRYIVSWPAELPRNPSSPSAPKILGLGVLGSLLLALLAAAALELRRGRIVQRWQIQHQLRLPILADQGRR